MFGTLVDWRTGVARETEAILKPLGHSLDWIAFADAWRGQYQPSMEKVRSGEIPFCRLDVLHRRNLETILPQFKVVGTAGGHHAASQQSVASARRRGRTLSRASRG